MLPKSSSSKKGKNMIKNFKGIPGKDRNGKLLLDFPRRYRKK